MAAERRRVLFMTSNGTGLGHLTRAMAIARRLEDGLEPAIFTLSQAAPVVSEIGFDTEYAGSHSTPGAGAIWQWNRRLRHHLDALLDELAPKVLVFDGAVPYHAVCEAIAAAGPSLRSVWCRRPMWKAGAGKAALARSGVFNAVLEPGEFAAPADPGPTVARRDEAQLVDPIVYLDPSELESRADAERELGLEPARVNCLLQLGQGPAVRETLERCLRHLAGRPDVQVAVLSSAIAGGLEVPEAVVSVDSSYPISRHYAAFDFAVAAAGYNAYHELISFGVPALFVPMPRQIDDQAARARYAAQAGVGLGLDRPGDERLEAMLDELLDDGRRAEMARAAAERAPQNGAGKAAAWIAELAKPREARPGKGRKRRRPPWMDRPFFSAYMVTRTALFWAGHRALWLVKHRPNAPRTLLIALGEPDANRLEQGIDHALRQAGVERPERLLVFTDSLEFPALRRRGVAFEHVPPSAAHARRGPADAYAAFVCRRLGIALEGRRRQRAAITLGEADPQLVEAAKLRPRKRRKALSGS